MNRADILRLLVVALWYMDIVIAFGCTGGICRRSGFDAVMVWCGLTRPKIKCSTQEGESACSRDTKKLNLP